MTPEFIKTVWKAIALVTFVIGAFGSFLCLPYAMTNSLVLIHTAGVYFIAGAVMIVGGMLGYLNLIKTQ